MLNIIKTILFIIVNIAGFYSIAVVGNMAVKIDIYPEFPPETYEYDLFIYWFYFVGMCIWIACALASISYFFMENEWKNWILLSPMFIPGIYGTAVVIYFFFVYTL